MYSCLARGDSYASHFLPAAQKCGERRLDSSLTEARPRRRGKGCSFERSIHCAVNHCSKRSADTSTRASQSSER